MTKTRAQDAINRVPFSSSFFFLKKSKKGKKSKGKRTGDERSFGVFRERPFCWVLVMIEYVICIYILLRHPSRWAM